MRLPVGLPRHADRRAYVQLDELAAIAVDEQRRHVTGTGQRQPMSVHIDQHAQHGCEVVARPSVDEVRQLGEHARGSAVLRHIRQHGVPQQSHRGGGSEPVTGDIADDQEHPSLVDRDHVIPVASHVDARSGRYIEGARA